MKVNLAAIFCALTIAKLRKHFVLLLSFSTMLVVRLRVASLKCRTLKNRTA